MKCPARDGEGLVLTWHVSWRIAAADEMHDLQPVAMAQRHIAIGGTRHNLQIALHRDLGRVQAQALEQAAYAERPLQLPRLAIQGYFHCHCACTLSISVSVGIRL